MRYTNGPTLSASDVEIGAAEVKDAASDTRAKVAAAAALVEANNLLGVQAPVLGSTTGAALDADGPGTHQQYLRGLLKAFLAHLGAVGMAADPDGALHGQLRSVAENTDALPAALGPALAAASLPVVSAVNEATVRAPIAVPNGAAAAISGALACPGGAVRLYAPRTNTLPIAIGYTGLTLANAVSWLYPGDTAVVPCTDASHVFSCANGAAQALNWETI